MAQYPKTLMQRIAQAAQAATGLGHELEWDTVGEQIAHGTCRLCRRTVVVHGKGGMYGSSGPVLEGYCPKRQTQAT